MPDLPSDRTPESPAKSANNVLTEWKELITGAFTAVLAIASIIAPGRDAKIIAAILTVVAVPLVVYGYRESHRRRRARENLLRIRDSFEADAGHKAGFRGLTPYSAGDRLPGAQRVREARRIVARMVDPDFRFGVLCGDSGSGKSSMLRTEVTAALKSSNVEAIYVADPIVATSTSSIAARSLWDLVASVSDTPVVVIIDQFEEYFLANPDVSTRRSFGARIQAELDARPELSVLVTLRREYLVEMRDLSPGLRDPLAVPNLFQITNFTIDEASDVIVDCARRDGFSVTVEFAHMLSSDLAEGGRVRPPELQIVCSYLGAGLDEQRYRQAGGAAGILSHHIQHALLLVRDREIGARVLRALCDFSSRTRKRPQRVDTLVEQAGYAGGNSTGADISHDVEDALRALEEARLIQRVQPPASQASFALIHDYLVEAVDIATRGASTQREEATQLLRYHLASNDRAVSLGRARFIKAHADPALVITANARDLIRRSLWRPAIITAATAVAAVAVASMLYTAANAGRTWKRIEVGRHYPGDSTGLISVQRLQGLKVLSGTFWGAPYLRAWDGTSGSLLWSSLRGNNVDIGPHDAFVLTEEREKKSASRQRTGTFAINVATGDTQHLPSPDTTHNTTDDYRFATNGTAVLYFSGQSGLLQYSKLHIYSLIEQKPLGSIMGTLLWGIGDDNTYMGVSPKTTTGNDRIVVLTRSGERIVPGLFEVRSGRLRALLTNDEIEDVIEYQLAESRGWIATAGKSKDGGTAIRLWSLDDGRALLANDLLPSVLPYDDNVALTFSADGSHLMVSVFSMELRSRKRRATILRTTDLAPSLPLQPDQFVDVAHNDQNHPMIAWWGEADSLVVWDATKATTPASFAIPKDSTLTVALNAAHDRLLIGSNRLLPHLWDLGAKKRVALLETTGRRLEMQFSDDEQAVLVAHENDVLSVFDTRDGSLLDGALPERNVRALTYDRECGVLHVWNEAGVVSRYIRGRYFLKWFRASGNCPKAKPRWSRGLAKAEPGS